MILTVHGHTLPSQIEQQRFVSLRDRFYCKILYPDGELRKSYKATGWQIKQSPQEYVKRKIYNGNNRDI